MLKSVNAQGLSPQLNARMLSMMTIGGSVGTGIFLASGNAIYLAGPGGTLLAYAVTGIMAYFLMTSLCEMTAYMPNTGSFYTYAAEFVDPALGYALAWNYWYGWAVTIASEISAASLIMHYWFPSSSTFIWCAAFLSLLIAFNATSVKVFGEVEYWLALIKVIVIVVFILAGFALIMGWHQPSAIGFTNWKIGDAPFHGGWLSTLSAFMIAGFSFQGSELVCIAAGESENPRRDIPRVVNNVFWRILIFFILSILVISFLIPYSSPNLMTSSVSMSPFTLVFKESGITLAASLINAVILIAILSTGNSGMYAATRMLWYLAKQGHLPVVFANVNTRGIPIPALIMTSLIATLAFLSSLFGNGIVYFWLLNAASFSGFIAWLGIAISHYRFRRAYVKQGKCLNELPYIAYGYPYSTFIVSLLCLLIIVGQNYQVFMAKQIDWYAVLVSYTGIPVFAAIWLGYKWLHKTEVVKLLQCKLP